MSEEHDAFTEPGSSEPIGEPLGPDKGLSLVCVLWLVNSAIGAVVALREKLPSEWIAGVYVGRDASAEFFKGGGTALSPGLPMMAIQAICTILSTRSGKGWDGRVRGADPARRGRHPRGVGGDNNL